MFATITRDTNILLPEYINMTHCYNASNKCDGGTTSLELGKYRYLAIIYQKDNSYIEDKILLFNLGIIENNEHSKPCNRFYYWFFQMHGKTWLIAGACVAIALFIAIMVYKYAR